MGIDLFRAADVAIIVIDQNQSFPLGFQLMGLTARSCGTAPEP
jgi:translation elongation factor EF-1alpha